MWRKWALALCTGWFALTASANEAGHIKVAKGTATIQRGSEKIAAVAGMKVFAADVITTGANSSVGITFLDNSLISTGPNSVFAIDQYVFDSTTHVGKFDGNLRKGTLAAVSGKMVKQVPESMRIRTPSSIMGVRGTEFVVKVDEVPANP
ncbi:MAG: FecR family protein [Betaproteobacteria bacterium]